MTLKDIEEELRAAFWVYSRMERPGHRGYRPAFAHLMIRDWTSTWDTDVTVKQDALQSHQIDKAEYVLDWLSYIPGDDDLRRLVAAHCLGASFADLSRRPWTLGRQRHRRSISRQALHQHFTRGLRNIRDHLESTISKNSELQSTI